MRPLFQGSVIRSLKPIFYGPKILPSILKNICIKMNAGENGSLVLFSSLLYIQPFT